MSLHVSATGGHTAAQGDPPCWVLDQNQQVCGDSVLASINSKCFSIFSYPLVAQASLWWDLISWAYSSHFRGASYLYWGSEPSVHKWQTKPEENQSVILAATPAFFVFCHIESEVYVQWHSGYSCPLLVIFQVMLTCSPGCDWGLAPCVGSLHIVPKYVLSLVNLAV